MSSKQPLYKKNDQVGELTIIRLSKNAYVSPSGKLRVPRWVCRCACGRTVRALQNRLRAGTQTSCGSCKKGEQIDPGDLFGQLTVSHLGPRYTSPSGSTSRQWFCDCSCGERVLVLQNSLKNGATTSCGCKNRIKGIVYKGKTYSLKDLSTKTGIPYATLYLRIVQKGQTPEVAVSEAKSRSGTTTGPGDTYNRLTVVQEAEPDKRGLARWLCRCECGNQTTVRQSALRAGTTKSCGCFHKEINRKHGYSHHPLYATCRAAIQRCHDRDANNYQYYGGRGIKVYKPWRKNPITFVKWLVKNLGPRPDGCSLDRINNNKGYQPGNLKWSTYYEQCMNRRSSHSFTYKGKTRSLTRWCEKYGRDLARVHYRIFAKGWGFEKALLKPT